MGFAVLKLTDERLSSANKRKTEALNGAKVQHCLLQFLTNSLKSSLSREVRTYETQVAHAALPLNRCSNIMESCSSDGDQTKR